MFLNRHIVTSPSSLPPPPESAPSASSPKKTRKTARLRSLAIRPIKMERLVVHMDPTTRKANCPQRKKLRMHLGIVSRDKVNITFVNWMEVPTT